MIKKGGNKANALENAQRDMIMAIETILREEECV